MLSIKKTASVKKIIIVIAWSDPNSTDSLEEYWNNSVANVSKLKGLRSKVIGNSFIVSTMTKNMPAIILILICGRITLKYVVEYLLPINREASSIDFEIFSNPESILLFDRDISLILNAKTKPIIVELINIPVSYTHLRAHET